MIGSEIRPIEMTQARDDAGGRREQRADEDHRVGEAAAHRPEQLADRVEQVLGHAAALEDQPHEREERHREQRVVRHHAPDALGQRLEQRRLQQAELDADEAEDDADGGERERDRDSRSAARSPAPTNISGAMFAMSKARHARAPRLGAIARRDAGALMPTPPRRGCAARDLLGELLLGGLRRRAFSSGFGDEAAQERDALDQLGDALQRSAGRSRSAPAAAPAR